EDGDAYTVTLKGPGTLEVAQADADGDGRGPIDLLFVDGTDANLSTLTVAVTRKPGGDGIVTIRDINLEGGLASLSAPQSDLTLRLRSDDNVAPLHALVVRDLKAGASIELESP